MSHDSILPADHLHTDRVFYFSMSPLVLSIKTKRENTTLSDMYQVQQGLT